ncbi:zinc finger protein 16-like [Diorhabda sublineata]|uniref:zinc finger protein 16-like n=1 Tax=Diorhabda sublineata TaxID=1163346 RepID=UPI0024E172D5|nr:zinc finger protein 16-like [Diorhabda sublineata]
MILKPESCARIKSELSIFWTFDVLSLLTSGLQKCDGPSFKMTSEVQGLYTMVTQTERKIKSPVKKTDDPSVNRLEKPPNEITKKGIGHVRGDNVVEEEKPEVIEEKVRKKREHKPKKPSLREVQRLLQKDSNPNIINLDELPNPLKCSVCNESFQTNREYAYHSVKHNNDNQYTCHFCDYKTDQKKQIKAHMLQHSVFKCKICEKIFKKRHSAYKHGERHMENNKVQCEICGKSLQSQSLKTHMKIVHTDEMNNQTHFCPICNKAYRYSSSVRKHISANHRELGIDVSVVCDICGKRISSKSKLMKHLSIHTGDKPHSCTVCYKKFRAIDTLRSHMVVHTGEKPYKCSYCGKGFGQNAPYRYQKLLWQKIITNVPTSNHEPPTTNKLQDNPKTDNNTKIELDKQLFAEYIPNTTEFQEPTTCAVCLEYF